MSKNQEIQSLFQFIENSPTCFHAIENIRQKLLYAGYQQFKETEGMHFLDDEHRSYFVIRNDASLIAFTLPKESAKGFHILAAHCDSPCFKLKEKPEIQLEERYNKLNVEKYGGMILSTWLDRPLGVAGRLIIKEQEQLQTRLVDLGNEYCVIPNLSIHFNREINKGYEYNTQIDMQPLFTEKTDKTVLEDIARKAGVKQEAVYGSDLFLYCGEKGHLIGSNQEYIMAPRLDDLECVYSGLESFLTVSSKDYVNVFAVFDNEEIGSRTRHGADSDFLPMVLQKIMKQIQCEEEQFCANSFLLSADNAHALHPNHPEKSDLTNKPYLNGGIVLKFHGGAHYTTDAYSAAKVKSLCEQGKIPIQTFANRSDVAGGSTLGNILTSQISIPSADIGFAQLAMHSAVETAGSRDITEMKKLFTLYFEE